MTRTGVLGWTMPGWDDYGVPGQDRLGLGSRVQALASDPGFQALASDPGFQASDSGSRAQVTDPGLRLQIQGSGYRSRVPDFRVLDSSFEWSIL